MIAALIGFRQWIFPVTPDAAGSPFLEGGSDDAIRSILGGLAFAIPGGLTFRWHLREARRRERAGTAGVFWGSALYFHLVAFVALAIALGGTIALLHSLIDVAVPQCFDLPEVVIDPSAFPDAPVGYEGAGEPLTRQPISECYPPSAVALRSALDALIVAGVAGATWAWHLNRGRRLTAPPEGDAPSAASVDAGSP